MNSHDMKVESACRGKNDRFHLFLAAMLLGAVAIFLVCGLLQVFYGRLIGDEGGYSLCARNVMEGLVPYRDFNYSQMPLMLYVYAGWFFITGPSVEAARVLSLIFSTLAFSFAIGACFRRSGVIASVICAILLALNHSYIYHTVTFKTQPITVAATAAAFYMLSTSAVVPRMSRVILAMLLMTLAFFSRLSILPELLLLWVYAIWMFRHRWKQMLGAVLVNILVVAAVFGIFASEGNMLFGIFHTHKEYAGNPSWSFDRTLFFLKGWLEYEILIVFALIWAVIHIGIRLSKGGIFRSMSDNLLAFDLLLLGGYLGVMFIHVTNVQSYPVHQTSIIINAAILGSCCFGDLLSRQNVGVQKFALVSVVLLALLVQPFQEGILSFRKPRSLAGVAEACGIVKAHSAEGEAMISFSGELAVNGGRPMRSGYNLGEFTYYPAMEAARAEKFHLTNFDKLLRDLDSSESKVFCVTDREFSIMAAGSQELAERIKGAVELNFVKVGQVDGYGQFQQPMHIFVRKKL